MSALPSLALACSLALAAVAQQPAGTAPVTGAQAAQAGAAVNGAQPVTSDGPARQNASNTLRVNTRIVVLDVAVVDTKTGKVVTDLTQKDFHVTEQDQPQTITHFYAPGHFTPPADVTINSTADLDTKAPQAPVNIVVLDEFNTLFEDMAFARYSLKEWLKKQPAKLDTPTMLCSVTLTNFTVIKDYTQDKQAIIDALEHHFVAYPWQAHNFAWVGERYSQGLLTLDRVAEASVGHPGHKNMIWIGRGLPTVNWVNYSVDDHERVNNVMQQTINELRDARVTLYTIDPAGVMIDPYKYGNEAGSFSPFGGDPTFEGMALATGGRALHGRNDVDAEIGHAIEDGSEVYSFSYRPTDTSADVNKFRNIKVTVDRPGVTVYARKGYYLALRPASLGNANQVGRKLTSELVGAGTSNMIYDAVKFEAHNEPGNLNKYHFHLEPETLSWYFDRSGEKPRWTVVLLAVTTFDKKGKALNEKLEKASYTAKAGYQQDGGRIDVPIDLAYTLDPDPKVARVKFVVRVEATGRMGTVEFPTGQPVNASSFGTPTASAAGGATAKP